jgi:MFS family permease
MSQWPLGRLSDRVDRRLVLLGLLIGAAITGVLLWMVAASKILLLTFGFLFGALALPTYSLAAAHGYDKTPAADMVATAATILLANAIGSVIGPLMASGVMFGLGPRGLFLFTASVQALLAVYVFYRIRVQAQTPAPEKHEFDLATTAPVGAVAQSELLDPTDPSVAVPETFSPPPPANDVTDLSSPNGKDGPR